VSWVEQQRLAAWYREAATRGPRQPLAPATFEQWVADAVTVVEAHPVYAALHEAIGFDRPLLEYTVRNHLRTAEQAWVTDGVTRLPNAAALALRVITRLEALR
jgi:hypothetical protein